MKKIFSIILVSIIYTQSFSQLIQASIGVGSLPSRIKIYLKSAATQTPSSLATLQFNIGVKDNITTPPNLALVSNSITGAIWQITQPPTKEGGFWNYNIFTTSSPLKPSFTAGTEVEAMELEFSNGTPNLGDVGLVTLPDGGASTGYAIFYCTGTLSSDGQGNLYYPRSGVTLDNQTSYNQPNFTVPGTANSTAILTSVTLPVKFTSFLATKKDNTAQLYWQAENETSLTAGYEIERSLNAIDFKKVISVTPQNNGRNSNSYFSTDDVSSIHAAIIYYRIKQTDKNDNFVYSEIKSVRLDSKVIAANIYPNPVKGKANLSLDLIENSSVTITLNDANGKQVQTIQMKGLKGQNTKEINMSLLQTGNYILRILTGTETKTLPVVKGD